MNKDESGSSFSYILLWQSWPEARLGQLDSLASISRVSPCLSPCKQLLLLALTHYYATLQSQLNKLLTAVGGKEKKGLLTDLKWSPIMPYSLDAFTNM